MGADRLCTFFFEALFPVRKNLSSSLIVLLTWLFELIVLCLFLNSDHGCN